ncbi:hypothetical protein Ahy_A07g036413 isoform E [Arachis hypogaea]|uniref:Uncharacterized protein n=1 Tax=Arachis hypogaea TaxID=3818 RepID=A0A445CG58_ARAHY|nr:hypothetical protein Ahy_A07g036413 isoform E [Arachis hypogaea]
MNKSKNESHLCLLQGSNKLGFWDPSEQARVVGSTKRFPAEPGYAPLPYTPAQAEAASRGASLGPWKYPFPNGLVAVPTKRLATLITMPSRPTSLLGATSGGLCGP